MKTVIIGGVAGGASAAARLRRLDEEAEIVMLERGGYVSFANCGLPYYIGGEITDKGHLTLQTPQSFRARFCVDVRVHSEAVAIDTAAKRVRVKNLVTGEEYEEVYDRLILSPGAKPIRPAMEGLDSQRVFTLRNMEDTFAIKAFLDNRRPRSAVVVGGGYIGVEMAENLKNAGLDVTIVELADHLIAPLDIEMAADVHRYIKNKGIDLKLGNGVQRVEEKDSCLTVTLEKGRLTADMLILSIGVSPDTALAKTAGLATNERGCILTDTHMRTSAQDVYAVGDAAEVTDFVTKKAAFIPLAGPANKQGRIAADNICGIPSEYTGTQGSAVLKLFDMTVAATGLNEQRARALGLDYDKTYLYAGSHAGYYPGGSNMSVKAIWEKKTLQLLGAQIVGFDGVDKRMDVLATAIRLGARADQLKELELCYAPPFGSAKDPVNMLGFVAENLATGKVKQFFWDEVDSLPRDGSITLLDVRTATEAARGAIEGFQNIPLDTLRGNLHRIEKTKPVYVHCHSGLRSYIACRILAGHGYDCYNLAGGYRLYESAAHEKTVPEYVCTQCK